MNLRDYQQTAVDFAAEFLRNAGMAKRLLLASPTGTGKSFMELALQDCIPGSWIVTPKVEIVAGLLAKRGLLKGDCSEDTVLQLAAAHGIYTPIRLRNRLLAGEVKPPPALILDEAHHDTAESWQDIHMLCGYPPAVGFTASPFRGTPKSTAEFRREWGEPVWVITMPEAVELGVLSFPSCSTVPLVDDDLIDVSNGELVAKQVNEAVTSRIHDAARLVMTEADEHTLVIPTMFSVPSLDCTESLRIALREQGIPAVVVTAKTPYSERQAAFRACVNCDAVLVQVSVVSEGVDLPIRCLIDCSPTLSPVKWLQQFGRITRPGGLSHYLCSNRNLLRHGYLLDGCLPVSAMTQAQSVFPPSSRSTGLRAIGLEAIGRLKPVEIPFKSGLKGLMYSMSSMEGHKRTDYCVIVHPCNSEVLWTRKDSIRDAVTGERAWGKWYRCEPPAELTGFASLPPSPLSDKQKAWWKKSAGSKGLDADVEITTKQFPILPVLFDIRGRL